jgi:hypothetical protein
MRRIVCSATLLLLVAAPQLRAQNIDLGVKGGVNIASVSTNISDIEEFTKSKTGFVGGIFASFRLGSGVMAIQPEVLYSQKGLKAEELGVTAKLNTNYIEIPLLLKANINAGEKVRPAFYVGPVVSLETSCNVGVGDIPTVDCDEGEQVGLEFISRKKTEWGIDFGGNLDILLGSVVLLLDVRYQFGLTNLNDDQDAPDESVKTRMWQVMAGIGFSL